MQSSIITLFHSIQKNEEFFITNKFNLNSYCRATFASQISVSFPIKEGSKNNNHKETRNSLYVLLRKYRGLKTSGYAVTSKTTCYEPYRLTITFREAPEEQIDPQEIIPASNTMLLVISATPVKSIYKGRFLKKIVNF